MEIESHFIFKCPIYYEIRECFHCLFRGPQTLAAFFRYIDQRCLALYIQEALKFRAQVLQPPTRPDTTQRITTFFSVLSPSKGTKRSTDLDTNPVSRSVNICGSRSTRSQRQLRTRPPFEKRTRSSRPRRQHFRGRPAPASSYSGDQTLLHFPQFSSFSLGC